MQNRSTKASGLVFGGLMAALMVLFAIFPFLSFLAPIPLVLVYMRYGARTSLLTAAATVLLMSILQGPARAAMMVPFSIIPGLVLGYGFARKLKPLQIGLLSLVAFVLGFAVNYAYTRVLITGGEDPIAQFALSDEGQAIMEQTRERVDLLLPVPVDGTPEQIAQVEQVRAQFLEALADPVSFAWMSLPAGLALIGSLHVWFLYLVTRLVLVRLGYPAPEPRPFAELTLPGWVAAIYFIVFGLAITQVGSTWYLELTTNLYMPFSLIMYVAGLAVLYGVLRKRNLSKGWSIGILVLGHFVLDMTAFQVVTFVAMLDPIFDVRGLGHGWFKRPDEAV